MMFCLSHQDQKASAHLHSSSQMRSHDLISRWPRPVAREFSQFTFTKMQYDCDIVRNPCANMGDIEILRIEKQENLPNKMVSSHISQALTLFEIEFEGDNVHS